MQVYLVGGAVRDELIGREVVDRDYVVVGATPEELLNQGFEQVGKDFPVFLHPHTKDEYALARTERKAGAGYTGFTCYAAPDVTLEDDLKRRDLTINAIAKSKDGELIDPFGGIEDIKKRQLRHVSEAFTEDPLRVLRLARFAARFADLEFEVAPSTWQLAQQMVAQNTLAELTQERVWHEISMALTGPNPDVFCQLLSRLKAWPQLVGPIARQAQQWDDLKTLSSTNETSLATAYAVFAWHLVGSHAENVKQLHRTLRVPNVCGDVANLTLRIMAGLSEKTLTPAYLMTLFKAADPLRRPERWQQALAAVKVISAKTKGIEYLEKTKQAYCDVDVQALVNSNLGGAELGRAIQARRQQAITTVLER